MTESATESDLLEKAAGGDQQAFSQLIDTDKVRLRQMIEMRLDYRLRTRVDVSDILQETWIVAFARLDDYLQRRPTSFYIWLRMVAGEQIVTAWRRHMNAEKRSVDNELPLNSRGIPAASSVSIARQLVGRGSSPSHVVSRLEECAQLQEQLEDLDQTDREILTMRHFELLTNVEVAEVLELTPSAASNRYVRALKRLREAMNSSAGTGHE